MLAAAASLAMALRLRVHLGRRRAAARLRLRQRSGLRPRSVVLQRHLVPLVLQEQLLPHRLRLAAPVELRLPQAAAPRPRRPSRCWWHRRQRRRWQLLLLLFLLLQDQLRHHCNRSRLRYAAALHQRSRLPEGSPCRCKLALLSPVPLLFCCHLVARPLEPPQLHQAHHSQALCLLQRCLQRPPLCWLLLRTQLALHSQLHMRQALEELHHRMVMAWRRCRHPLLDQPTRLRQLAVLHRRCKGGLAAAREAAAGGTAQGAQVQLQAALQLLLVRAYYPQPQRPCCRRARCLSAAAASAASVALEASCRLGRRAAR